MRSGARAARRARAAAAASLLLWCSSLAAAADAPLDPGRLAWRELRYRARKFIFTAETTVKAELVPVAAAAGDLLRLEDRHPVQPLGDRLARLELDTVALGRHTRYRVWLEPSTGAALQSTVQEFGSRARYKLQRFTDGGVMVVRFAPAPGEDEQPADRWTRRADSFAAFPRQGGDGAAVTDSTALFWILSTAPLTSPGDTATIAVTSRSQLMLVTVTVRAAIQLRRDVDEHARGVTRHLDGSAPALDLSVDATPLGGAPAAENLEFLGMKGSIRIVLDPRLRTPLEISGRVPGAGTVIVRLRDVTLAD
jgi:hypothetical protein